MTAKSGLVLGGQRRNLSKPSSGVLARAYVMKAKRDVWFGTGRTDEKSYDHQKNDYSGADAYLAYIMYSSKSGKEVSQVQVVREFADVFPGEFPRMPRERVEEFLIELDSVTTPISYTLYRMAPLELNELKERLKDLLNKGFIRPSMSLWDAPILFVKKKDETMRLCIDYY
ncbi:uncharacterized protein LOC128033732 [Gossypium raimondii]|uniref:uncharacterized protein LOC128033732 n=1 Tax=Gossypium raimondii TaxID=29730 RepID=UPI00227A6185|nr:uncharacterized protein LOC128033732 [Gossypium raimondii]